MFSAHVRAPVRLPALCIDIAQGEAMAADHEEDHLGPTRIHLPPVLRLPAGLNAQRADLLARAACLTSMRAERLQTRQRILSMTHHARRAVAAAESVKRALVWGGVCAVSFFLCVAALQITDKVAPEFDRSVDIGSSCLYLIVIALAIPPVLVGPVALRYAYHVLRRGDDLTRADAQRDLLDLGNQLNAQEEDYAQRFEVYRRRELLALRRDASEVVMAGTHLPRDLALMVLDYQDPGSEFLRSAVPLPWRRVEIVEVD